MSFDADGLPNPASDPVSPLLAFICNSCVKMGGAVIGKTIEKIQEAPGKLAEAAAATTAVVSKHVDNFNMKPSATPETVSQVKERMRSQEIDTPALPEVAKSAAMGVQRAEAITAQVQEATLEQAMGKQVVAASMERQQQQMAMGYGSNNLSKTRPLKRARLVF